MTLFGAGVCAQTVDSGFSDWQERWDHYVERTYSWKNMGLLAADSLANQTLRLEKCTRKPYCLPHNVGGAFARRITRTSIELGAGALLREDIRRRPSGLTGFMPRAHFALTHALVARGRDGEWELAYSRFAGTFGAITVSTDWHG